MASKELTTQKPPESGALVPIEQYAILAESPENMRSIVADNLGGGVIGPFDLEQIRVPSGGGTLWERKSFDNPDADKDGNVQLKELQGIVSYYRDVRTWWKLSFDESGGGGPPDCQSQDNIHGIGVFGKGSAGNPTGLCSNCPKAQWKSDRRGGPGQDCSQNRLLFLTDPQSLLPMNVKVPSASYTDARRFFISELTAKALPYWSVIVRLSLFKDKSWNGIIYSKIRFGYSRVSAEMKEKLRVIHEAMQSALANVTIDLSDVRPQDAEDAPETQGS